MSGRITDEFNVFRRQAEAHAMDEIYGYALYVSGNKYKRTKFNKAIERYIEDIEIDRMFGIISESQFKTFKNAVIIMKKSMEGFVII
jgi:hypothetical protein